ncbi:hypothetical protein SAMN05216463_10170 [Xylanibacter ruminicola]|uniref:Uncharacterized protein n=1 Tax=Xylanibacter ruminicola TaxID=839 RepID=A0A1M6R484_XYLRU|nr:hypothetical protein SAMN05216463_10170 [Xylanibacter ruminicola]
MHNRSVTDEGSALDVYATLQYRIEFAQTLHNLA